jgi:hypothetical protein
MEISQNEAETFNLIQIVENNRISQIGLSKEQSSVLQILLSELSVDKPFVRMGSEYDLTIKSDFDKLKQEHAEMVEMLRVLNNSALFQCRFPETRGKVNLLLNKIKENGN